MRIKSRSRLYGGVVTQRIANPLSPIENIRFFLSKTALGGRNGWRTCKTFAAGAAALALAGCGGWLNRLDAEEATAFASDCLTYASPQVCREHCLLLADFESGEIQCLHVTGRAAAAAPDPAPELAGGREDSP